MTINLSVMQPGGAGLDASGAVVILQLKSKLPEKTGGQPVSVI